MGKGERIFAVVVSGFCTIGGLLVVSGQNASASTHPTAQVRNYNDGWIGAEQDNCQQGFRPACEWLSGQTLIHPARELLPWWLGEQWMKDGCVVIGNRTPAGDQAVRFCRDGSVSPS